MIIDTSQMTKPILERAAIEGDPEVRRILELSAAHMQAELDGDLDAIMATLIAEPLYHIYNVALADGTTINATTVGQEATRKQYVDSIAAGTAQAQDYKISMVVADRFGLATDGYLRVPWDGAMLKELGHDTDPNGSYLYEGRLCSFWPVHESGLFVGEDIYFDPAGFRDIANRRYS
jgi:hypothetical protein